MVWVLLPCAAGLLLAAGYYTVPTMIMISCSAAFPNSPHTRPVEANVEDYNNAFHADGL